MRNQPADSASSVRELRSKLTRYEALFELTSAINAASDIESAGRILARRLKYVADVYAWRYICFDEGSDDDEVDDLKTIVVDGYRGSAAVTRTKLGALTAIEQGIWRERKTHVLHGEPMTRALAELPEHLHRDDINQISVNTLVENAKTRAIYLFCKRRQPFTELDGKCLSMICSFFHPKIHALWERQKLRDLELAYLKQEVMLRQNEKLATLGRLSAGMAHELNNPASAVRQGIEHLRAAVTRLERARFALGAAALSDAQRAFVRQLEQDAEARAKVRDTLDPIARSDREQETEEWLERHGIEEPWEHASALVTLGFGEVELEELAKHFDSSITGVVIDYLSSRYAAYAVLEEMGHGARRIAEIIGALKGYSYMDQAPVQSVDVRQGLDDTLVMMGSKLRDGIRVDVDYAEDLPRIQGYGSELNQVWTNLIDNAIGAMNGSGTLALKAYASGNWVVVEVADTGHGIPEDVLEKVFDPFFTTKAPGEGTGLGLNISHSIIVEKHDGEISVDSKPGATRFTVKLPIDVKSPAENADTPDLV